MSLSIHLVNNIAFNQWANLTTIEWLQTIQPSKYEARVQSSFPTIKALMKHLLSAEYYYASTLMQFELMTDLELSMDEIFQTLIKIDQELLEWVRSLSEEVFQNEIKLNRSSIEERYSVAELLTHLTNHSSYHRGQLLALRGQISLPSAPQIDFYRFISTKQKA